MHYTSYRSNTSPASSHPGYRTRPSHQVFPEDIDCVVQTSSSTGAIYIGNLEAAQNLQTLRKHKISSLLTACKNIHIRHPKQHVPYCLYVPGEDHENYDLSLHFETAADFIHQSLQETNILVHCMAGISRSVTLVIAYLIKYRKMGYQQAMRMLQTKRSKINPNPGFVRQLQQYEQKMNKDTKKYYKDQDYQNYAPSRESYFGTTRTSAYGTNNYTKYTSKESEELKFKSRYEDYSKYLSTSNLQVSKARVPNPEQVNESTSYLSKYQLSSSKPASFYNPNKTVNQREPRNYRALESITNYSDYSALKSTNIQDMSKDLDERIAKIKQKYYEEKDTQVSRNVKNCQQRRLSSHVASSIGSSSIKGRQSFGRGSYNPFHAVRTMTYQYI